MTQKALFLSKAQGDFKVDSRSIPRPGTGELLVKVLATALNPVDWKIQGELVNVFCAQCIRAPPPGVFCCSLTERTTYTNCFIQLLVISLRSTPQSWVRMHPVSSRKSEKG